ncbi:MAG: beta-lactamase family protein, partial [Holophagales bacterium]|nr:beta-lactamase family protein [Holophagales bacterium]
SLLARHSVIAVASLLLCSAAAAVQDRKVDEYVSSVLAKQGLPGISVAVLENGKILIARGYGYASLELRAPATAQTLYGLGSISKQFTATAVMLLVEDGKADLDEPVSRYVPNLPESWAPVTIRHLLNHTSGIKEETWEGGFIEFDRHEHDQYEVLKTAFGPLEFIPGERWAYRNSAYRLLGMMIEEVSGDSVWDFQRRRIFEPAGMNATRDSAPKVIIPHRARGYGRSTFGPGGGPLFNREPVAASAAFTEGALISSVLDMARWDVALRTGKVLSSELLQEMWTPVVLSNGATYPYGLGWRLKPMNGQATVSHGGGVPGFITYFLRILDSGLTVITLTNCDCTDRLPDIARRIASFYDPMLEIRPIEDNDPEIRVLAEEIVDRTVADTLTEELFDEETWEVMSQLLDQLRDYLAPLGARRGPLVLVERSIEGPNRVFRYRVNLGESTYLATFVFDPDDKLASIVRLSEEY